MGAVVVGAGATVVVVAVRVEDEDEDPLDDEFDDAGDVVGGDVVVGAVLVGGGAGVAAPTGRQIESPGTSTVSTDAPLTASRSDNATSAASASRIQ